MKITQEMKSSVPFQYAEQVRAGEIVTGGYIQKAVDRFFSWIDRSEQTGYFLDHAAGMHIILFFEVFLQHTKGEVEGSGFTLSPYQQFTLYNVFAWKKLDSEGKPRRVIKTIYEKVARKNGKTALLAGVGLYCMAFDDESGPEIYVGATKEAQAKILWEQAYQYVFKSVKLRKCGFKNTQREIRLERELGVFRFLGGDSNTLDGLNPSVSIIDEYHSHKNDGVREVLESAMGARREPLIYIITTAGFNKAGVCKQYEDVCKEILDGIKEDDSTLVMIHEPDKNDDWEDPQTWKKANPNLGISVNLDYLKAEYTKAKNQPSKIPNFKTKHCNLWVDALEEWIPSEVWNRNQVDCISPALFKRLGCFAGMDLSTRKDITALVLVSNPDQNGIRYIKPFLFCPLDTVDHRSKEDMVPYRYWVDEGFIEGTPGNTVDFERIKDAALEYYYTWGIHRIELDEWNAHHIVQRLMEAGLEVSYFSQGIRTISFPTKEFEKLLLEDKLKHDGNPVMAWMLSGCEIYTDPNENIKVTKRNSNRGKKRVDGIISAIMALGGSLQPEADSNESAYNDESVEISI